MFTSTSVTDTAVDDLAVVKISIQADRPALAANKMKVTINIAKIAPITARIGAAKFISTIWKAASLPPRALKTLATATRLQHDGRKQ